LEVQTGPGYSTDPTASGDSMNYLAHLYLAQPNVESRVGNLLGDFARGVDVSTLPQGIRAGLYNHRAVDAFTDRHPSVSGARTLFSRQRRRFAGVALDVLFDHFLIRHWASFSTADYPAYVAELYDDLNKGHALMPVQMSLTVNRLTQHDWLNAYASLDQIGRALDRIAARVRFDNRFGGIIEEIRTHETALERIFLEFFPVLTEHVQRQRLEAPGSALQPG